MDRKVKAIYRALLWKYRYSEWNCPVTTTAVPGGFFISTPLTRAKNLLEELKNNARRRQRNI